MHSVLIAEDDSSVRLSLKLLLEKEGYKVWTAENGARALSIPARFSLAIVDFNLPDTDGAELIHRLKQTRPGLQTVLITGERAVSVAVMKHIKRDCFHFLPKPFEPAELLSIVRQALIKSELLESNRRLSETVRQQFDFKAIVGKSRAVLELTELMAKVAKSSCNLLITGESGTGKELAAKSIHCAKNPRRPFVSVNCGAVPKDLLESEFFGHVRGAFTGALYHRKGKFQLAGDGSLFLDEIGSMDLSLQVKLLRALQERRFEPVGGSESLELSARVIAAANIDLEQAISQGSFREDLYYRLNTITVHLPPLRERRSDIPLLLRHFIEIFNKKRTAAIEGISDSALRALCAYPWPGNVRELENLVERLSVLKEDGVITLRDLPLKYQKAADGSRYSDSFASSAGGKASVASQAAMSRGGAGSGAALRSVAGRVPGPSSAEKSSAGQVSFEKASFEKTSFEKSPFGGLAGGEDRLETVDISDSEMDFNTAVDRYENSLLLKALEKTKWNRRQAAFLLKMNRTTLVEKIKKKGLKPPAPS